MKGVILFLYIFSAINCLSIVYLLYKTKNGKLKKWLLVYFGCISFGLVMRFLSWYFGWEGEKLTIIIMLPVAIAMAALTKFLYKTYRK